MTLRPSPTLTVVCSLWFLLCSPDQLLASTATVSGQDDGSGQPQAATRNADEPDDADASRATPAAAKRRLESRQLALGGSFIGYVDLPPTRPVPNTAPSHEEMKAATTPAEFRTPPAVSFGWSWNPQR